MLNIQAKNSIVSLYSKEEFDENAYSGCFGTPIHAEQDVQMSCSTGMCENDPRLAGRFMLLTEPAFPTSLWFDMLDR